MNHKTPLPPKRIDVYAATVAFSKTAEDWKALIDEYRAQYGDENAAKISKLARQKYDELQQRTEDWFGGNS